jgi:DNA transposition AAA+ family ATPase
MSHPHSEFDEYLRTMSGGLGEQSGAEDPLMPNGFLATEASRQAIASLEFAYKQRVPFALVTGPAGTGKTVTCCEFARAKGLTGIIRCHPNFDAGALLTALEEHVRVSYTSGFHARTSRMVQDLSRSGARMVILDEAQLINRQGMEMAKLLADESRCTFVLVMSDEFAPRVRGHKDINSRIGTNIVFAPVSLEELKTLELAAGFTGEAVEEIHALTSGILRDVVRLINQVDETVAANAQKGVKRGDIDNGDIRVIANRLYITGLE